MISQSSIVNHLSHHNNEVQHQQQHIQQYNRHNNKIYHNTNNNISNIDRTAAKLDLHIVNPLKQTTYISDDSIRISHNIHHNNNNNNNKTIQQQQQQQQDYSPQHKKVHKSTTPPPTTTNRHKQSIPSLYTYCIANIANNLLTINIDELQQLPESLMLVVLRCLLLQSSLTLQHIHKLKLLTHCTEIQNWIKNNIDEYSGILVENKNNTCSASRHGTFK